MIIYVQSKSFPLKTFVTSAKPKDKVARIRAQMLHILYELGKDEHLFRLRYRGQILRDVFTLESYSIGDNSVLSMIAVGKSKDILLDVQSIHSSELTGSVDSYGQYFDIKQSLEQEVTIFNRRETMLKNFKALIYAHFLFLFLSVLTTRWYSVFWLSLCWLAAVWYLPTYSRQTGFVGNTSHLREKFFIVTIIVSVLCFIPSLTFTVISWKHVATSDCDSWTDVGACDHTVIFTGVLFALHCLLLVCTIALAVALWVNILVEMGDLIELKLVQEKDIETVIALASSNKLKEKQQAAQDFATLAALCDDNKFRIVAEGGLDILNQLILHRDAVVQEHSMEALSEMLTIPAIQDTFVEMGGVSSLTAALHSENPRAVQEAAGALYTIVSDSDENKYALTEDQGLEDLAHAAHEGTLYCQRTVASIFLELVFNSDIRERLSSKEFIAEALVDLCKSNDLDTQIFALQSLEVLAIHNPALVCSQEDLIGLLLSFPFRSLDERLYLLCGKILLYFTEKLETCRQLLNFPRSYDSLQLFAKGKNPVLQKVVIKIIFSCCDHPELIQQANNLGFGELLELIRDSARDKEAREMAVQSLEFLHGDSNINNLTSLTTLEKINKMGSNVSRFGSQVSTNSAGIV